MNVQISYLQVCSSQMNNFQFSLHKCVGYDGQCIVMNVLGLFRLNIVCVKKLFLCLAVLVVGIADQKATVLRESGQGVWGPK